MAEYYGGDKFYIEDGMNVIVCESKSGRTYFITEDAVCTCKGYSIRQYCRHVTEATTLGLFSKLEATKELVAKMSEPTSVDDKDLYCRKCGTIFCKEDNYCGRCGKKRIG